MQGLRDIFAARAKCMSTLRPRMASATGYSTRGSGLRRNARLELVRAQADGSWSKSAALV